MYVLLTLLAIYAGSIAFIRIRNRDKFPFVRQLSDFSTFMVIFNLPSYLLSRIPMRPFVDTAHYPHLKLLEDNWEVIRDEAQALYRDGYVTTGDDMPASSFYKNGRWTSFNLKSYHNRIPSAYELAPKTMALIDQVPEMNYALFAALHPGKNLKTHHDPFAFTLRYSLSLISPNSEQCGLIVDGEPYHWKDGEGVLFDQTYMHSAYNDSDQIRLILMTDVDRPMYFRWVERFYYHFARLFNRLFAIDNVDAEYTGIGNILGKGILAYSGMLKSFKRKNRSLYVAFKLMAFALIAFLVYRALS